MTRFPRWGLRARFVIAFVDVALVAADLATIYSNLNLDSHVTSAARARLERSVTHFGDVAGVVYSDSGGWTEGAISTYLTWRRWTIWQCRSSVMWVKPSCASRPARQWSLADRRQRP